MEIIKNKMEDIETKMKIIRELEDILSNLQEMEVKTKLKEMAKSLIQNKDQSLILYIDDEYGCLLVKNEKEQYTWMETKFIEDGKENNECIIERLDKSTTLSGKKIIAAALAQKLGGSDKKWLVPVVTCRSRLESIINKKKREEYIEGFVASLYIVNDEGVKLNISDKDLPVNISKSLREQGKRVEEIISKPQYKTIKTIKKTVIVHESVRDEEVIKRIQRLKDYIISEKIHNKEKHETFMKIIRRIAVKGKPDLECLEILQRMDEKKTGIKRAKYRIGAYIVNANLFCEFTRVESSMKESGWFPLKYNESSDNRMVLTPIKNTERDEVANIIHKANYERVQPRIICIMRDRNGKKVVNSCFYDLKQIRNDIKESIPIYAKDLIMPIAQAHICNTMKLSISHKLKDAVEKIKVTKNKDEVNKTTQIDEGRIKEARPSKIPILNMIECDLFLSTKKMYEEKGQLNQIHNENSNNNNNLKDNQREQKSDEINVGNNERNEINIGIIQQRERNMIEYIRNETGKSGTSEEINRVDIKGKVNESTYINDKKSNNINQNIVNKTDMDSVDKLNKDNDERYEMNKYIDGRTVSNENKLTNMNQKTNYQQEKRMSIHETHSEEPMDKIGQIEERILISDNEPANKEHKAHINKEIEETGEESPKTQNKSIPIEERNVNRMENGTMKEYKKTINMDCEDIPSYKCILNYNQNEINLSIFLDKRMVKGRKINICVNCNDSLCLRKKITDTIGDKERIKVQNEKQKTEKDLKNSDEENRKKTNNGGDKEQKCGKESKIQQTKSIWDYIRNSSTQVDLNTKKDNYIRTVDIYGTGKGNIYVSPWTKLVIDRCKVQAPGIRILHKIERERFINEMSKVSPRLQINGWLALPLILKNIMGGVETEMKYKNIKNIEPKYIAIKQFYKGAWGKSIQTLLGESKGQINMSYEQALKLFPRADDKIIIEENIEDHTIIYPDAEISGIEVQETIKELAKGKSAGLSGLTYEILKEVGKVVKGREIIKECLRLMFKSPEQVPGQLYTAKLVGIQKPGGGIRPLCMQEVLTKLLHKILLKKMMKYVASNINETQKCLALNEGQLEARNRVINNLNNGKCLIQYDFVNAFGSVKRKEIIERLYHYNVPQIYIKYIAEMLNRQKAEWLDNMGELREIKIETGVPQGEPLSMLLFAIGIDRLIQKYNKIEGLCMTAYADDIVMIINNPQMIIKYMKSFAEDAENCGLKLNLVKTKVGITERLSAENEKILKDMGVQICNIKEDYMNYVGLPLTLSNKKEEEAIESCVSACLEKTQKLWNQNIPLQMKYHLQKMCIDSTILHILKVTPISKNTNTQWMKKIQKEFENCWKEQLPASTLKYARLPVKYFGLGLLNIKDKRRIIRAQWEAKNSKEQEKKNVVKDYYNNKIQKWVKKQEIQQIDIENMPQTTNMSLATPPYNSMQRLSDGAFRTMIVLRYCTKEMEHKFKSINSPPSYKCCNHKEKNMTIQHAITCNKMGKSETIRRHNVLISKICGLLLRNKKIGSIRKEAYTTRQSEKRAIGKGKRADIVYLERGKEHSVDLKVTSSWPEGKGNTITNAWNTKKNEYENESNVHIILFDTAGNATKESYEYLRSIGAKRDDIREMQKIIFEFTNAKIDAIAEIGKQKEYKEARQERKVARRKKARAKRAIINIANGRKVLQEEAVGQQQT